MVNQYCVVHRDVSEQEVLEMPEHQLDRTEFWESWEEYFIAKNQKDPRTSTQARPLPRQLCRVNVGAGSPSDSALTPSRTGIAAMVRPVDATVPNPPTSADVACMPSATTRSGDARTVPKVPNRRISGGRATVCRATVPVPAWPAIYVATPNWWTWSEPPSRM